VTFVATATEALTHLRFTGKVKWNEVNTDQQGHRTKIGRYDIQLRVTNAAGTPIENEDLVPRLRMHLKAPPRIHELSAITNPSGSTFRISTRGKHGMVIGDNFKIRGCKDPNDYNSTVGFPFSVASVVDDNTLTCVGDASGLAACENPGELVEAEENDDKLHIIVGVLHRPRTWYWQARVRAVDESGCRGNWTAWTSPLLPWTGADPGPDTPSNLQLDFDKVEQVHHAKWRMRMQWDEVRNFDYPGTPADDEPDLSKYVWQLQTSDDGVVGDDWTRKGVIEANDDDADTYVRKAILIRNPRNWHRFRVRSVDRFNRRSAWSAWTSWQRPNREVPPRPTDVTIFDASLDRVVLDWDAPDDPEDGDEIHPDIHHFQAQISTSSSFASIYKRDRFIAGERRAFKIPRADRDLTFYGRVRSVNSDKEKSSWIPATDVGNNDPGATPIGVRIGKGDKFVLPFSIRGTVTVGKKRPLWTAPDDYRLIRINIRAGDHDAGTHPDDGCPTGSPLEANLRVHDVDDTTETPVLSADTRLKIPAGSHKDSVMVEDDDTDWNVTQILKGESLGVRIATVGSTNPGEDLQINVVLEPLE
jgi:hypothetical protein